MDVRPELDKLAEHGYLVKDDSTSLLVLNLFVSPSHCPIMNFISAWL